MTYYLAIDIGASSGRHIVGWLDGGKLNLKEVYRFANGAAKKGGILKWNAERLFQEVKNGLKAAKEQDFTPSFIGIDTWAVDYALLDENDNLLDDVYSYRDDRTARAIPAVHKRIAFEKLYQKTGIQFQPFNTVYQLYADKLSGRLNRAKTFLMLPDYLNYLLTGVKRQEYTNATSTGMINAQTHCWDRKILSALEFPQELFVSLSRPSTAVGELKEEIAREVGFSATVLLPATHDTASAVLAAPIEKESPYISSGTWSLLGIEQETAHTDENSRNANYSNEGSIDYQFRYQKNIMGLWLLQSVRKELGNPSFETLAQMARCKESIGLINVNDKRFLSPDSMIEEINQALKKRLSSAAVVRVIYDSLAQSYAEAITELEQNTGKTYDTLNIIGGGSHDSLLNELTAKATGKKIITGPIEATAIGNLVMQMIGAGEIKDLPEARRIIKESFPLTVIPSAVEESH
ncbi:MAG: rhamnulokinase [Lachnospiraceae bacterium]|nr:rhamnulokinase [Lachnospiraceae bacterium]